MLQFNLLWNIFSYIVLIQTTLTLIIKLFKTISNKYNLKQNITLFSSIAYGCFNNLTAELVNDLNDTHQKTQTSTPNF